LLDQGAFAVPADAGSFGQACVPVAPDDARGDGAQHGGTERFTTAARSSGDVLERALLLANGLLGLRLVAPGDELG